MDKYLTVASVIAATTFASGVIIAAEQRTITDKNGSARSATMSGLNIEDNTLKSGNVLVLKAPGQAPVRVTHVRGIGFVASEFTQQGTLPHFCKNDSDNACAVRVLSTPTVRGRIIEDRQTGRVATTAMGATNGLLTLRESGSKARTITPISYANASLAARQFIKDGSEPVLTSYKVGNGIVRYSYKPAHP